MGYLLDDLEKTAILSPMQENQIIDLNQKKQRILQLGEEIQNRDFKDRQMLGRAGLGAAAVGGGLYAYNRYKKKKREQADQEKVAAWLVNKEKKQRVRDMKFLGHNLERAKRDAQSYKSKADLLKPEEEVLWSQLERARKRRSEAIDVKHKNQVLKEQLHPEEYAKDPHRSSRERANISLDSSLDYNKDFRNAERHYDSVYSKRWDYDSDAKRHQENAKKIEQDIKSQAKEYGDNFFGPNPQRKKELQRKEHLIVGAGIGTAAALGGGAYLYNRYKKKKREQAEQEKD